KVKRGCIHVPEHAEPSLDARNPARTAALEIFNNPSKRTRHHNLLPRAPPAEPAAVGQATVLGLCADCAQTLAILACKRRQRDRCPLGRKRWQHQGLRQRRASSVAAGPGPKTPQKAVALST